MRTIRFATLLAAILALSSSPVMAAEKLVKVEDVFFSPKSTAVPLGDSVRWRNDGDLTHTTTSKKPYPSAWDRSLNPGQAWRKTFSFAGTYGYYCRPHSDGTNGMVGQVRVPVSVSPRSGGNAVTFVVRIANAVPPSRWTLQVQRKINGGSWTMFKERIARKSFNYRSSTDGTHRFRARLAKTDLSVVHGWSPIAAARIA